MIMVEAREELERKGLKPNTLTFFARVLRQTFPVMSHRYLKAGVEEVKKLELRASFTQMNS